MFGRVANAVRNFAGRVRARFAASGNAGRTSGS